MNRGEPPADEAQERGQGGTPTRPMPPPPPHYSGGSYPYPPQQGYSTYPYPYPPPPVKKGLPRWFWVIMGLLGVFMVLAIVGIIFFGVWFGTTLGKPVEAINKFYSALAAGRCDEARSLLATSVRDVDYCARWNELKAQGETNAGNIAGSINIRNGLATVSWRLQAGGRAHSLDIQLEEIGGQWKIIGSFPDLLPVPR